MAISLTIISSISIFIISINELTTTFLIVISVFGLYNSILEAYVALTFISPGKRKVSLKGDNWEQLRLQHEGPEIVIVKNKNFKSGPLMLIIHGWRSSSSSMLGRAELYLKRGFNVIIMELPGHGSAEAVHKWNAGVSVRNFMYLFNNLDDICDTSLISQIYCHGHSMGGFVFLRFTRESSKMKHNPLIKGYILESPLTCYSQIFEESCRMLRVPKFLKPLFWKRLKFHFNMINPGFEKISDTDDVDVPIWGLPDKPTLIVQAANDERLGLIHHERLVESFNNSDRPELLTNIVLEDLTHAGARNSNSRNDAISNWLDSN